MEQEEFRFCDFPCHVWRVFLNGGSSKGGMPCLNVRHAMRVRFGLQQVKPRKREHLSPDTLCDPLAFFPEIWRVRCVECGRIPEAPRWGLVDSETHELSMVMDYGEVSLRRIRCVCCLLPRQRLIAPSLSEG